MPGDTNLNLESALGKVVVEQGLATAQEVQECLEQQRKLSAETGGGSVRSLSDLLVANGIVTARQLSRISQEMDIQHGRQQIPGYKLMDKLGAGAMATVFKARQLSLDRIVAVKVLPQRLMKDAQFIERFYAEGRAAAKLNHANIVQAIDVGKSGDFHYFVMEYVEGYTVYDYLVKNIRYSEEEALKIIIQMADALNHAHERGFIHRDVKPKNIMITTAGVAKLADMGLARDVSDREAAEAEAGRAYGTPYYISPEQIRGEVNIDARADIYGLGATFYHMVTGKVPFEGPNPSAVMHKHLKQPLVPPDHVNPDLTAGVSEIIEVMMAKKRDERYANTAELLEDLRAVAAGQPPIQARRRFSIASLAQLEDVEPSEKEMAPPVPIPLAEQPMFWLVVGSGMINVVLIVWVLVLKFFY